jgi:hypothetical protein
MGLARTALLFPARYMSPAQAWIGPLQQLKAGQEPLGDTLSVLAQLQLDIQQTRGITLVDIYGLQR